MSLHKPDGLLSRIEALVASRKAWAPIGGATRRAEPAVKLTRWLQEQNSHADHVERSVRAPRTVRLALADFPPDDNGNRTITTARRIVYLVDSVGDFLDAYEAAFGASAELRASMEIETGAMLYVTNSVEGGGRAFSGDPFTGQVAAYTQIFARDWRNQPTHAVFLYYPHQLFAQIFQSSGQPKKNKGTRMVGRLADALVFAGGITVNPRRWSVLDA